MPNRFPHRLAALAVELTAGTPPTDIRLLPAGRFRAADGSGRPKGVPAGWLMDDATAARLVAAANARTSDYAIDYEHQTINAAANGQPAPAAGWFKRLEWRAGDGLYAMGVRWTERAAAMIAAGEYRYLSPVFSYDADGRVLALGPAALVNSPALDGLTDLAGAAALSAYFSEEIAPMKELLKALGLTEIATEADALAALAALKAGHGAELVALKSAPPNPAQFAPIATLSAVQGELATARAELATLKGQALVADVDAVVVAALAAGKLTPATEAWARDLGAKDIASLKVFISGAPVVAAPGTTQTGGKGPAGGTGGAALSADQVALCAQLCIAPEDFRKTQAESA